MGMNSEGSAMGMRGIAALVVACMLAGGCAPVFPFALAPGRSTEADVRRALGEPARVFVDADGTRTLAFVTAPQGTQTHLAQLSPDGRLLDLAQVLSEESFGRIAVGRTTGAEVERMLGPPWRRIAFANKGQVAWDYRFRDAWGYLAEFSVMLDARGVVAETVTVRQEPDRPDAP